MSASHNEALTVTVSDLHAATSFYLSALQPLDYCHISTGSHQTSWGASQTVGLGPSGTSRVDLFLSQSDQPIRRSAHSSSAQIVFPALSRVAVREAYAAALNAGGRTVSAPQYDEEAGAPAVFAAVVTDLDKNKLRIEFDSGGSPNGTSDGGSIPDRMSRWSRNAEQTHAERIGNNTTTLYRASRGDTPHQATETYSEGKKLDSEDCSASHAPKQAVGKGVVGALIGAAAGAALAYSMVASQRDSKQREKDFSSRMKARDRVKTEPWEVSLRPESQSRHIAPKRRGSEARRDSGYWSINDRVQGVRFDENQRLYNETAPGTRRSASMGASGRRHVGWESQAASEGRQRRARRSSVGYGDKATDTQSRSHFPHSPKDSAPMAPPSSTSRWKDLFRPPAPPKMPSPPWQADVTSAFAMDKRPSLAGLDRSATSRSARTPSTVRQATKDIGTVPGSVASRKSYGTAIRTALPPSVASSSRNTVRSRDHSARSATFSEGGTKLTASSLAAHNIPLPESSVGRGTIIDDLETVMPDDSISSVDAPSRARSSTSRHSRR